MGQIGPGIGRIRPEKGVAWVPLGGGPLVLGGGMGQKGYTYIPPVGAYGRLWAPMGAYGIFGPIPITFPRGTQATPFSGLFKAYSGLIWPIPGLFWPIPGPIWPILAYSSFPCDVFGAKMVTT